MKINQKYWLLTLAGLLMVGIVFSVIQIVIAGTATIGSPNPPNPGHTWGQITNFNCPAGEFLQSKSGDTLTCGGGTGTVTSVGLSMPTQFSVSGSPVTTSGTLTASWSSQSANTVLAAPSGAAGTPSFRALVAADIPSLEASKITSGIFGVARGGTNASTIGLAGSIAYSTGAAYAFTGVGTAGQSLLSGGSGAPYWGRPARGPLSDHTAARTCASSGSGETSTVMQVDTNCFCALSIVELGETDGPSEIARCRVYRSGGWWYVSAVLGNCGDQWASCGGTCVCW